jgi:hypothetical protein
MTDAPKLSREQQLAAWRKQQKHKSRQNLKTFGSRIKKEFLQSRLRFWGCVLLLAGIMTIGMNVIFFLQGEMPVASAVFAGWGLFLVVVAIMDFVKVSIGMLTLTGVVTMIQGVFAFLSGGFVWGPVLFVAGILMLRDSSKAKRQEKEKHIAEQSLGGDSENRAEDGAVPGAPQG